MYYEEKVINGILCCRTTPDGRWVQFSQEQLTLKLLEARRTVVHEHHNELTVREDKEAREDLRALLREFFASQRL